MTQTTNQAGWADLEAQHVILHLQCTYACLLHTWHYLFAPYDVTMEYYTLYFQWCTPDVGTF